MVDHRWRFEKWISHVYVFGDRHQVGAKLSFSEKKSKKVLNKNEALMLTQLSTRSEVRLRRTDFAFNCPFDVLFIFCFKSVLSD